VARYCEHYHRYEDAGDDRERDHIEFRKAFDEFHGNFCNLALLAKKRTPQEKE